VVLQILAGAALGLLLGTVVGFSQSPVAATVVGALTGALVLFLGFSSKSPPSGQLSADAKASAGRLSGFGFTCTAALLFSLFARTRDLLGVPIGTQIKTLTDARFSEDEAHSWVAYKNSGLYMRINREATADKDDPRTKTGLSVLFSDPGSDPCFNFDPNRIPDIDDRILGMRNSGPRFTNLADAVSKLDKPLKESVMQGIGQLICPQGTP